jgi:CheY-like chemotaxis protein
MHQRIRLEGRRLGIAVGVTAAALLLRLGLLPLVGFPHPHVTFLPAVMIAAWLGGLLPGLLACLLSALASAFFLSAGPDSLVSFLLAGVLLSLLGEMLQRSRRREQQSNEALARLRSRQVEPPPAVEAPSVPAAARRILVVEDDDNTAESLALLLRLHGHEVHIARDGNAALVEARSWRPEVVFLDLGLPGNLDGHETARRLRASRGPALRLIALTGCAEDEDRRLALQAGFDTYLVKPAGMEDISRVLEGP